MGIIGVGTDLVEVDRFRPDRISEKLIERVFTPAERTDCASRRRPWIHLAARFAAKEAAVKALSSLMPRLLVSQIEVTGGGDEPPVLRLAAGLRSASPPPLPSGVALHVSLSHAGGYALAMVVAETSDR